MEALTYTALAIAILAYGLVSGRAEGGVVTAPMAFVVFGFLSGQAVLRFVDVRLDDELVRVIAELALILILFSDASRIHMRDLVREHSIPIRLLGIGLPLTIVIGTVIAASMFGVLSFWEACLIAIVLAPTDAALGQAVVSNPAVPVRIRQALNVESGLNDGIALPFLLVALALATAGAEATPETGHWLVFAARQVILGPMAGLAIGYAGARLLRAADSRGWVSPVFIKLSALGVAMLAFGFAELVGGNGFIAAFCAGLMVGNVARRLCEKLYEFGEAEGQLLALITFGVFGAVMVPRALGQWTWSCLAYAVLSLTLVRFVSVALSLIGTRLRPGTVGFLGWFGPRGIASILYALLILGSFGLPHIDQVITAVTLTVLLSVFAHGFSAVPLAERYGRSMASREDRDMPEMQAVSEMPLRMGHARRRPA